MIAGPAGASGSAAARGRGGRGGGRACHGVLHVDQCPKGPDRQLRVQALAHPAAAAPGQHQSNLAQHSKTARDLGLGRIQSPAQVAYTVPLGIQQQGQDYDESRARRAPHLPLPPGEGRGKGTITSPRDGRISEWSGAERDLAAHTSLLPGWRASP